MMLIIMIMMQKRALRVWSTGKSILLRDLMIILLIIMLISKRNDDYDNTNNNDDENRNSASASDLCGGDGFQPKDKQMRPSNPQLGMHIDHIANTVYITKLARPDETITSQERKK